MDVKEILNKLGDGVKWPFVHITEDVATKVAETVVVGVRAGLSEVPVLEALLLGKSVNVNITVKLNVGS